MQFALITPEELDKLSRESDVRIIDARTRPEYGAGHIPGAIIMAWEDWCSQPPEHLGAMIKQPGYWGELCQIDQDDMGEQLALLGLSNNQEIVVYADGAKSKGREGRIAWMLLYLGAKKVKVLNGGFTVWLELGKPAETKLPVIVPGKFQVEIQGHRRMLFSSLREAMADRKMPQMLDTRSILEHIGDLHKYMPRRGRIPGSELIAYTSIFNADGTFVDQDEYLALIPEKVRSNTDVVVYCEVGPRASMVALLHEAYAGQILPVYDGSMMQWGAYSDLPVEKLSQST